MAAVCGVSRSMLSMCERGLRAPGTRVALAYGQALAETERKAA